MVSKDLFCRHSLEVRRGWDVRDKPGRLSGTPGVGDGTPVDDWVRKGSWERIWSQGPSGGPDVESCGSGGEVG